MVFRETGLSEYECQCSEGTVVLHGDGRRLPFLEDECVDCAIVDHPWLDSVSNSGGNRNFARYDCFQYSKEDFVEKARVLKPGAFLCEVLPEENANNFDYLYSIKKMAESAGFLYYAKVPWEQGNFVSNIGRKSKDTEDLMIFSKGKARALMEDVQRSGTSTQYKSGTNGMLPTRFCVAAVPKSERVLQSEKPVVLYERLLEYLTLPGELVLDQYAGSGAVGVACRRQGRRCILVEKDECRVESIVKRMGLQEEQYGS